MKRLVVAAAVIGALAATAGAQDKFTYVDLARRLTDLERLAVLPAPGDTCAQWSSYDRGSKYDEAAGKYVKWDAKGDGGGIIRKEGETSVMAEMEGPGCIWRIWSAKADAGHVKIYLDGAAEPAVDLPFAGYFDGKTPPFVYPSLVHVTGRGLNNYVPIPYQKSCKIVAEKGWGNYFHFGYETFPKGTVVPTFRMALAIDETAALKAADVYLSGKLGTDPAGKREGEVVVAAALKVPAGRAATVYPQPKGERAITAIRVKVEGLASREDQVAALRELAIRITWDGETAPAVWAPLGDFFGTAPGINKYKSLPLGMTDEGFYSFWYMPFAKGAMVELVNDGAAERTVEFSLTHAPLARPAAELGRFHAKWHRDALLPAEPERRIDWTMVKVQGRGRFCGASLHVWNPKGGWWGEGDEKFFVDGEKFPSTFGTGSEDYFGYAWGDPHLFQNAYHNQTISQNNKGHISVNRWHITENVPFQKSFEGNIEKYFPNTRPTLYAAVAYWYLAPGGKDPYPTAPLSQRVGYWDNAAAMGTAKVPGAIEGEEMTILSKTAGQAREQDLSDHEGQWSGGKHLWWTDAKVGDKLELAMPVQKAGGYRLAVQLTKANDYAIVQMYLDSAKLGQPVDLYSPNVIPATKWMSDPLEINAGQHKLTFEIVGAAPAAKKAYMVGIDYVKLEAAN